MNMDMLAMNNSFHVLKIKIKWINNKWIKKHICFLFNLNIIEMITGIQ